jgi:hypothetical protein
MARGQRKKDDQQAPRSRRLVAGGYIAQSWGDIAATGEALLVIPEGAETPAEPDRLRLRAYRAKPVMGGWEPGEEVAVSHIRRPWERPWIAREE